MRFSRYAVSLAAILCLALFASPAARAGIKKCVDAQGRVTLTDRPCPADTVEQDAGIKNKADPVDVAPSRTASDASTDARIDVMKEALEAARRDLQSKCERGDQEACVEAVCMRLHTDGMEAGRIVDCSRASGFKYNARWAQMSKIHTHDHGDYVEVSCLKSPEVLRLGGRETKIFRQFRISSADRATAIHEAHRYFTNLLGGPDFASWEEAADAICAR